MTVTSPPSGTHVPRPVAAHRSLRARLRRALPAIALTAVLVAAAPLGSLPAVAAPAPTPTPTSSSGILTGKTTFTLSPIANGTVRVGEGLAVSVSLHNGTGTPTQPIDVTLALGATPLRDRAALTRWLAGDTDGAALSLVGSASIGAVAPGAEQTSGIVLAPGDPVLVGRGPGVYPLTAAYDGANGPVQSTSVMIVPPEAGGQVGLGVVVPITAGRTADGLLTSAELAELTGPAGSLTDQLDAVEGTPAILAVDPAIPAAIRVLGTAAPLSALQWLTRLKTLPNSRFALQFGDADVAVQVQAGLARPLPPLSLRAYMNPADFAPVTDPTPAPSPTVAPDGPAYPGIVELTDVGTARAGVFWPDAATAGPSVVAALGSVTVAERESLTLIPSTATRRGVDGATVPGRAVAGEADLLVYDADVSRELHDASIEEQTELRGASLSAAAAYLSFAALETGGEPLVVTLDRGQDRSRVALRTAITSAVQAPGVAPLTLGGVAARIPATVEIADAAPDETRVGAASMLVAEEAELSRFATILDDVPLLTGPERAEILQLLGLGWRDEPREWQSAVDLHRAGTATTIDSVGILPPSPINLFSAGAPIPIWVRNDLPYPVNVVLFATPDDLRLDVKQANEVTAGPRSNTRVQVPVQARVGNGDVAVQLQLRSRTLEPIGAPQVVEVNVRADWEGIGVVVLSVLVGGFILLGIVRTVLRLRARRARRDQRAAPPGADGPTDAGPSVDGKDST